MSPSKASTPARGSGPPDSRCGVRTSSAACAWSAISRCLTTRAAPLSVWARRRRWATRPAEGVSRSSASTSLPSSATSSRASMRKYLYGSALIPFSAFLVGAGAAGAGRDLVEERGDVDQDRAGAVRALDHLARLRAPGRAGRFGDDRVARNHRVTVQVIEREA